MKLAVRRNRQIRAYAGLWAFATATDRSDRPVGQRQWPLTVLLVLSACIEADPSFNGANPTATDSTDSITGGTDFDSLDFSTGTTTHDNGGSDHSSLTTSWTDTTSASSDATSEQSTATSTQTTTDTSNNCVPNICFANNEDRSFDNERRVTGGVNVAYRMNGDIVDHWITGVEIFTGEVNANSRIAIRDSMNNLPRNALGSKDFTIQVQNSWQGVTFDNPIALPKGTDFWIDWFSVDGVQATISQSGSSVPYAWRIDEQHLWAPEGTRLMMVRVTCCDP